MRHAYTALAVFVAALAVVGVASASEGKSRIVVASFSESYAFSADCAELGPYAFEIDVVGDVKVRVTDVVAADGELLQTVIHVVFTETDTNSVSGKSLPLHQAANEVWDYASNTRTISGAVFVGNSPAGKWVQDTGRITMTLDTRIASFVAGPHEAFFGGGLDVIACGALAGS